MARRNYSGIKVDINRVTYQQIIDFLNEAQLSTDYKERKLARILKEARLSNNQSITNIIGKSDWNSRFATLADAMDYEDFGVQRVYKVVDSLIYDIRHIRNWISDFSVLAKSDFGISNMGQLVVLGQAILGRAIELCPMETGALRKSGTLIVYDDSVVITFSCPYATYVHEDLNKHHDIGRAKFLELALQEMLPKQMVWVETHGEDTVWCSLSLDNTLTYKHYD